MTKSVVSLFATAAIGMSLNAFAETQATESDDASDTRVYVQEIQKGMQAVTEEDPKAKKKTQVAGLAKCFQFNGLSIGAYPTGRSGALAFNYFWLSGPNKNHELSNSITIGAMTPGPCP